MVPSPVVRAYAEKYGVTPDGAVSALVGYQREVPPRWFDPNDRKEDWLFGVSVVDGGTNSCTEFETMAAPGWIDGLEKAVRLFTDLGLDPMAAKYYLLVQLT